MRCPKSRFPIPIIVFDELELIIFVSQGLTLSTASLVLIVKAGSGTDLIYPTKNCTTKFNPLSSFKPERRNKVGMFDYH